jgi:ABC-2 type transport system ATP-binding protein
MSSITTEGLTRRFGHLVAVDQLDLDLPDGGIVGLVGPNGSGKSTLIRMLLHLIRPTHGHATVLGAPIHEPAAYLHSVGALIENPAFVPSLSARRNLRSLARLRGLPEARVDHVLARVGLEGRDAEPVKDFSLGMKQRLGIAAALLPDPRLLILDEPTNGLDPAGIVEVRALLRELADEGRTVVVSSHLLAEIQAICDHVVVIRFGELLFSGPIDDLLTRARSHVDLAPEHRADLRRLVDALQQARWPVEVDGDVGSVRVAAEAADGPRLNRLAADVGIVLAHLVPTSDTLEDVFLTMTGSDDGELAAGRAAKAVA